MPPRPVPASFWRGGTSRGLLFRAKDLAPFSAPVRDNIIRAALGSPDPAGRQISGLGGGVSSLSKAAIVGRPGEGLPTKDAFKGVSWADEAPDIDCVYRFAQVGVRDTDMDWTASCGNMLAACAVACIESPSILPYSTLFTRAKALPQPPIGSNEPLWFPLRILSASNGNVMAARVPIDPVTLRLWEPAEGEGCEIAGVPGKDEPPIEVEMPLDGGDSYLVTGNARDIVNVEGRDIPVSIVSSGLPNVFVQLESLNLPSNLLSAPSSILTSHPILPTLLEQIRRTASAQFNIPLSLASPKITLVGPVPTEGYVTSSGGDATVQPGDADLLVRAVSSGDFHASIPGTTLGALNLAYGTPGTIVARSIVPVVGAKDDVVTVRAAHIAGVSSSTVRFEGVGEERKPKSVVMLRTAREIMRGSVMVPERAFMGENPE
ncbi:DUF453-domain-containing protein [Meredithblackwellia eburnea MCA 4105]